MPEVSYGYGPTSDDTDDEYYEPEGVPKPKSHKQKEPDNEQDRMKQLYMANFHQYHSKRRSSGGSSRRSVRIGGMAPFTLIAPPQPSQSPQHQQAQLNLASKTPPPPKTPPLQAISPSVNVPEPPLPDFVVRGRSRTNPHMSSSKHYGDRRQSMSPRPERTEPQSNLGSSATRSRSLNPPVNHSLVPAFWVKTSSRARSPTPGGYDLIDKIMHDQDYNQRPLLMPSPDKERELITQSPPMFSNPNTPEPDPLDSRAPPPAAGYRTSSQNSGSGTSPAMRMYPPSPNSRKTPSGRPAGGFRFPSLSFLKFGRRGQDSYDGKRSQLSMPKVGVARGDYNNRGPKRSGGAPDGFAGGDPAFNFNAYADFAIDLMRKVPQLQFFVDCVDAISMSRFAFLRIPLIGLEIVLLMLALSYFLLFLEGLIKIIKIVCSPAIFLMDILFGTYSGR